jgi:hypothetical protein
MLPICAAFIFGLFRDGEELSGRTSAGVTTSAAAAPLEATQARRKK